MSSQVPGVDGLRARVAALHRHGRDDEADRVRTKLAVALLEDRIVDVVARTPAPDSEDRARLRALLDGGELNA